MKLQMSPLSSDKKLLLVGASRGLGFALTEEYLKRGWHVVATGRVGNTSQLHRLLEASDGRLEIETVDIVYPDQIAALRAPRSEKVRPAVRQCRRQERRS